MQSDKDKEQQVGQPPQQDAGGGMSASGPAPGPMPSSSSPEKKKGLFGSKGPKKPKKEKPPKPPREKKVKKPREKKVKKPREKKPKAPKGPKKPLFSFGKKKKQEVPLPSGDSVAVTAAQSPVDASMDSQPPAEAAVAEKPAKKSLFGGKKERTPKKPRVKKEKKPKAERVKKPKGVKGKKPPREKKIKEKKPKVAGAGKKKGGGGFGGSKMSPVGLDIGRSSMTAVRLKYQTGGSILLQAANDALPEGLIQEGEVRDVEALSFAIKEFWKEHKIKGKKVALGLANQKVVVRTLEFPLLDPKELRSAIEFQAQDYIPIPIDEAVFDFHVLGRFTDEDGIEKQKVLVVAAQKVMVMDFINAIKAAKLSIADVDLQAFALLRALAPVSFLDQGPADRATAIANIGSDVTNLVVDLAGEPQFTRIISFGGDDFTKALQDLQGISFAEAERLKASAGLSDPAMRVIETEVTEILPGPGSAPGMEPGEEAGEEAGGEPGTTEEPKYVPGPEFKPEPETGPMAPEPGAGPVPSAEPPAPADREDSLWGDNQGGEAESEQEAMANMQRTLESVADALADEIRRSLDYYMSQEQSAPIGRLLISGGGAMLRNLDAHLGQIFPFEVETGNPMMRVSENRSDLTEEQIQAIAPQLTIALGLALEDEE